jgi:hypothetical protein
MCEPATVMLFSARGMTGGGQLQGVAPAGGFDSRPLFFL